MAPKNMKKIYVESTVFGYFHVLARRQKKVFVLGMNCTRTSS